MSKTIDFSLGFFGWFGRAPDSEAILCAKLFIPFHGLVELSVCDTRVIRRESKDREGRKALFKGISKRRKQSEKIKIKLKLL